MKNNPKEKARQFLRQYGMQEVNLNNLKSAIIKQGYTIVEFNNIFNDENVTALVDALNLSDYIEHSKGFTYADKNYRLIFLHEDLSEDEKLIVLAHEAGHIYCEHFKAIPIIGKDIQEEHEANEFSHYLLHPRSFLHFLNILKKYKKLSISIGVLIAMLIIGALVGAKVYKERSYFGDFYITEAGSKYHKPECIFIKNKTNVHRMTKEEFENGEYEPCKICLPQD